MYGNGKVAVKGLDVDLFEGHISVLLGHNGAGKSTAISMITGTLPPTRGDAFLRWVAEALQSCSCSKAPSHLKRKPDYIQPRVIDEIFVSGGGALVLSNIMRLLNLHQGSKLSASETVLYHGASTIRLPRNAAV